MEDYENSSNEDQIKCERSVELNDYIDNIDSQTSKLRMDLKNENYIELFIFNYLNYKDISRLEDRDIYVCPEFDDFDRNDLLTFETKLEDIFFKNFAIKFVDSDIYIYNCVYNALLINLMNTALYFINGLQKLDESFNETLPNWKELSYKYYIEKLYKDKLDNEYSKVSSYIQYIFENCEISLDNFIEIALLESTGNVELSAIYIESANQRIICEDEDFFARKIKSFLFSDIYNIFVSKVTNIFD